MLNVLIGSILFVAGACLGSFLNVLILRYGTSAGVLTGRSVCPHCQKPLRWWELIPVFSFLYLQGRCARCSHRISWQYVAVEIATGVLLVTLVFPLPVDSQGWMTVISEVGLVCTLLVLGLIDWRTYLLPDLYIGILAIFVIIRLGVADQLVSWDTVSGAGIGTAFLFVLWFITYGQGIGLGDIKLLIPLGALFGLVGTGVFLFLAFCLGAVVSVGLLLRGTATLKTAIPFGPFLTAVALLLILFPALPRAVAALILI